MCLFLMVRSQSTMGDVIVYLERDIEITGGGSNEVLPLLTNFNRCSQYGLHTHTDTHTPLLPFYG